MIKLNESVVDLDGFYELVESNSADSVELRVVKTDGGFMAEFKRGSKREFYAIESNGWTIDLIEEGLKDNLNVIEKD